MGLGFRVPGFLCRLGRLRSRDDLHLPGDIMTSPPLQGSAVIRLPGHRPGESKEAHPESELRLSGLEENAIRKNTFRLMESSAVTAAAETFRGCQPSQGRALWSHASLSTCSHCKDTKDLLNQCHIDYDCVDVDLLEADKRRTILEEIKKVNPQCTFPTLVAGDKVVIGFKKADIKEALGIP